MITALSIPADHPAFDGHFPGNPILPGVVLLDEALLAIASALQTGLASCQITSAKFLHPVKPGDALQVQHERSGSSVRFDILRGELKVATGSIRIPSHG